MTETFLPLTVSEVIQETPDAVTLKFMPEGNILVPFEAGQYLTLRVQIEGKIFRRAYSLSTSPLDKKLSITVKQVPGGKVSTYLCKQVVKGAKMETLPPMGDFTFTKASEKGKSYFMFAGGSGITPIYANLKTILQTEPQSNVYLLFANKNATSIIFKKELESLLAQYPQRFWVEYVLEEMEKKTWLSSFFSPKNSQNIVQGIADKRITNLFLDKFRPQHRDAAYFICGPTPMMDGIEELLLSKGINPQSICLERFTIQENTVFVAADAPVVATLHAHLRGEKIAVQMREGQTVLDALLKEGFDPPYSCRTGSCATCIGKCTSGKLKMKANAILEESEIEAGLVLTCQAIPLTDVVEISY